MLKTLLVLFVGLVSSTSFAKQIDQVCRDGIGSVATISIFADNYIVDIQGPAKEEFIKRGYFVTSPYGSREVGFQSPLNIGPWGTRIYVSNQYITQVASWEGSSLVVRMAKTGPGFSWRFDSCER